MFAKNTYIMGYVFKNDRNGMRISKIAKLPSLRPLELKTTLIRQFEVSENLEDIYGKCC